MPPCGSTSNAFPYGIEGYDCHIFADVLRWHGVLIAVIRCHQNAFRYFGGYPEEILYDKMKQVVIKRLLKHLVDDVLTGKRT